jgi:glycosyltransferase involved in cell wall biosynthesis
MSPTRTPKTPESLASPPQIEGRYVLLQTSTPVYLDDAGGRWLDSLWAIDAREHLSYIRNLTIACPTIGIDNAKTTLTRIDSDPLLSSIRFVDLPAARSRLRALAHLPRTWAAVWRAVGQAEIVHMGIAGFPYPLGWLGFPIARLRRRKTITVVESAPWRIDPRGRASLTQRLMSGLYESLGKWIVRGSDLKFFTTEHYRQSLCGDAGDNAHVVQASWIPSSQVIADAGLEARLALQDAPPTPIRVAFFGRLAEEKGIEVLLSAMRALGRTDRLALDIYGDGPQREAIQTALASEPALASVRFCGTVAYGAPLFELLRTYSYVVVPSLSDEQPRIVYDAYSQGVPVIASDTDGLRQCVQEDRTGLFFMRGSADGLAEVLRNVQLDEARRRHPELARNAVQVARSTTHAAMHASRARLIAECFEAG